jgi:hypothetical protein
MDFFFFNNKFSWGYQYAAKIGQKNNGTFVTDGTYDPNPPDTDESACGTGLKKGL